MTNRDMVNHPPHYNRYGMEAIHENEQCSSAEEFVGFLKCTIRRYIYRVGAKWNDIEDLKKARWYLDYWIEYLDKKRLDNDS